MEELILKALRLGLFGYADMLQRELVQRLISESQRAH